MRIVSCNPLELRDPDAAARLLRLPRRRPLRAGTSSAPSTGGRTGHVGDFDEFVRDARVRRALPELEFMHESPLLNLYVYPEEVDYARSAPLAPTWHRLECSVRRTDEPVGRAGASSPTARDELVYLSLGSLGSADLELMQRLVGILAASPAPADRRARARSTSCSSSPTTLAARSSCPRRTSCRRSIS